MQIQSKISKRKYPKGREVNLDNIREYKGLENLNDKQAQQAVSTVRFIARMFHDEYMRLKNIEIKNSDQSKASEAKF